MQLIFLICGDTESPSEGKWRKFPKILLSEYLENTSYTKYEIFSCTLKYDFSVLYLYLAKLGPLVTSGPNFDICPSIGLPIWFLYIYILFHTCMLCRGLETTYQLS